jgi:hypothetical protein
MVLRTFDLQDNYTSATSFVLRTFGLQDNYTSATSFVLRTFGAYCNAAELQDICIC